MTDPDLKATQIDQAWRQHYAERRAPSDAEAWETGVVRFYRPERLFGFITADADQADIHISATTLARCSITALASGDRVEFIRAEKPAARSLFAAKIRMMPE